MAISDFKVGQTVLLFGDQQPPREVTITRVGRKNVYVTMYGRDYPFDALTGWEVRGPNAAGVGMRILTPEQHAEQQHRKELLTALKGHGFRPTGYSDYSQDTATLEKVLAVLDTAAGADKTDLFVAPVRSEAEKQRLRELAATGSIGTVRR